MASEDVERLARESVHVFNRGDWERARALTGPGFVYEETGTGQRLEGFEQTLAALQAWKQALPDGAGEILRLISSGDTAVLEVRWTGTHAGPLDLGPSTLPPSGRSISVLATLWQRWENGQMIEERHHIDMLGMLTQLGALPAPVNA